MMQKLTRARWFLWALGAVCWLLSALPGRTEKPKLSPEFAHICGVSVGQDTMEMLERRLGPGLPQIGGHPHGARLWLSPRAACEIWADAFHYNDRSGRTSGRVLDSISITPPSGDPDIPRTDAPRREMCFLGAISLGMKKADVLRTLASKLPAPNQQVDSLIWTASGRVPINRRNHVVTEGWRAELRFKRDRLREIRIEASVDYAR